jgi:hypothetical protein
MYSLSATMKHASKPIFESSRSSGHIRERKQWLGLCFAYLFTLASSIWLQTGHIRPETTWNEASEIICYFVTCYYKFIFLTPKDLKNVILIMSAALRTSVTHATDFKTLPKDTSFQVKIMSDTTCCRSKFKIIKQTLTLTILCTFQIKCILKHILWKFIIPEYRLYCNDEIRIYSTFAQV